MTLNIFSFVLYFKPNKSTRFLRILTGAREQTQRCMTKTRRCMTQTQRCMTQTQRCMTQTQRRMTKHKDARHKHKCAWHNHKGPWHKHKRCMTKTQRCMTQTQNVTCWDDVTYTLTMSHEVLRRVLVELLRYRIIFRVTNHLFLCNLK